MILFHNDLPQIQNYFSSKKIIISPLQFTVTVFDLGVKVILAMFNMNIIKHFHCGVDEERLVWDICSVLNNATRIDTLRLHLIVTHSHCASDVVQKII